MDVVMPQMGESIAEGTIVKWLKKPGDAVEKDEPLFEISTDKVDAEIPSPATGVLQEILVGEGNTVEVNSVVAKIAAAGEPAKPAAAAPAPPVAAPAPAAQPAPAPAAAAPKPQASAPPPPPPARPAPTPSPAPAVAAASVATLEDRIKTKSSPVVRKMAAEHQVDITQVPGSGIHGRVTKSDLERHLEAATVIAAAAPAAPSYSAPTHVAPAAHAAPPARPAAPRLGDRVEPMSVMRLKIAEHMVESRRTSAHAQTVWELDVSNLEKLRKDVGEEFLRRNGVKLTFTAFVAKATCDALKAVPIINSSMSGSEIHYHGTINLGIAVALDWGLIVPVIQGAGDMNVSGLAKSIADLAGRARSKKLAPGEVTGGTFTITNPGIYGGLFGIPIINQPQVAILGVGGIEKRPVVIDDAIAIRPMAYFSLSFDHRVVDGAVAEQFMGELKRSLAAINEAAL